MARLHRAAIVLTGIVVTLLSLGGAGPAIASTMTFPPPPGNTHPVAPAARTIVISGMPGWQIALIAVSAALVAATAAVMLDRARTARRRSPVAHARQAQVATPQ